MNATNYRVSLDIHDIKSQATFYVKKGDTARQFIFGLTECGKHYVIADGCTAVFRAKKSDGTVLYNNCVIEGDTITYELTSQTSATVGIVECELTLYGADSRQITSPRFALLVDDTLYDDSEVESQDEFTALQTAIAETINLDVDLVETDDGYTISITDKDGETKSADIHNGSKGDKGDKGEKGDRGEQGIQGTKGDKGDQGIQGIQGEQGIPGKSVTSASIVDGKLVLTLSDGTTVECGDDFATRTYVTDLIGNADTLLGSGVVV